MYQIKNSIYLQFDKTQKSYLCHSIKAFVKKHTELLSEKLLEEFINEQKYYLEIDVSKYSFLRDYLDDEKFLKDTLIYIKECKKYYDFKEKQKPLVEKQKKFEKEKRKFFQELKMSKEKPTIKQINYYKKLCKRFLIDIKNVDELSKLELRDEIGKIINEYQIADRNDD
ncbi:hypothetical protein IJO12_04160 [bacterium]|nr:hypothetical protein [bacterium]